MVQILNSHIKNRNQIDFWHQWDKQKQKQQQQLKKIKFNIKQIGKKNSNS